MQVQTCLKKQIFNPYLPSYEYIPDGEPYVFDGRVYVFGSHDRFGANSFCENHYVTWSAPIEDLSDWRYEGIIFRREQDPLNQEGKYPLFAPDVEKGADGKYYLYYAPAGTQSIGVAVCDTPGGQYQFLSHIKYQDGVLLGQKWKDAIPFDPAAFRDEDGKVYLYYGFSPMFPGMLAVEEKEEAEEKDGDKDGENDGHRADENDGQQKMTMKDCVPGPHVAVLSGDMYTIAELPRKIEIMDCPEKGHTFFEASSMRKINGIYYFIYSSQNSHELCYATGKSPAGPFTYGGVIHSNGDIGYQGRKEQDRVSYTGNNHGSLVELLGKWYIFGHRMTNYNVFSRQGVAEQVQILADGSIPQVEMTSFGLGAPLKAEGTYEARIACVLHAKEGALHYDSGEGENGKLLREKHPVFRQDGEDRENHPNQHIANMQDGAVAGFKYFIMEGNSKVSVRTRGSSGFLAVTDGEEGSVCAKIRIEEGSIWHDSETVQLSMPAGKQALYFTYQGTGGIDFMSFTLTKDGE